MPKPEVDSSDIEKALLGFKGGYGGHSVSSIMKLIEAMLVNERRRAYKQGWDSAGGEAIASETDARLIKERIDEAEHYLKAIEKHSSNIKGRIATLTSLKSQLGDSNE